MRYFCYFLFVLTPLLYSSCNQTPPRYSRPKPSFQNVIGTEYTEIRRSFNTGLAYNQSGYQLQPDWKMKFLSNDSVRLYNPLNNRNFNFHVYFDHDSVINMARVWLRVKKVSMDSLVFQLLDVKSKKISGESSLIYMTFYADTYIRNKLNTNAEILKRPNTADSLFIRNKIRKANMHVDSNFAARNPVKLQSLSTLLKVEKARFTADPLNHIEASEEYLYPEFNIVIDQAYMDFFYSFSVIVDYQGKMHFKASTVYIMPEFEETRLRTMKGIMEGYLQRLLKITPGKTLGMPHNSLILVNVKGIKGEG
jgi:hypothetical protein